MTTPARTLPSLNAVLYRRARRITVPAPDGGERTGKAWQDLEQTLGMMSVVLDQPLHDAMQALSDKQLRQYTKDFLGVSLSQYGAHKRHRSLFRRFPDNTPQDTYPFYLRRLLAFSMRDPSQPCALDGDDQPFGLSQRPSVTPERACMYGMFDPEQFGGCPVCGRVVGPEDAQGRDKVLLKESRERLQYFIALRLDTDQLQTARQELTTLLARTTPLPPQDRDDLRVLLTALGAQALPLLPAEVPQRETLAVILGTLLAGESTRTSALTFLDTHTKTATDLLRVLDVMGGGDASLTGPNTAPKLPRPLRRAFLARLEALDPRNLTEDLHRYPARWKKAGETLHPFEYARQFPKVALAFAALRGTTPKEDALGEILKNAKLDGLELLPERLSSRRTGPRAMGQKVEKFESDYLQAKVSAYLDETKQAGWQRDWHETHARFRAEAKAKAKEAQQAATTPNPAYTDLPHPPRLKFTGWAGRVEKALAQGNTAALLHLLSQRSGELGRRADKLLQVAGADALPTLQAAVPQMTTPMLLLLRAHLSARTQPWPTRLFFPKASAQAYVMPDTRPPLDPALTLPLTQGISAELLSRAAQLPRFAVAVLDERLKSLPIPFAQRNAARALVTLGRGASLKLPQGRFARLFVHWMEHEGQRVDLDLSVAFYDHKWKSVGKCDFTNLRFAQKGAVHSGDFTSAPAPAGASEFIDLDVETLLAADVQYVVMTVMSFNGVAFENMAEAFAGYMLREHADGALLDMRTVEQRFDLRGSQQVSVPLALDLYAERLHWLDTTPKMRAVGAMVGNQVAAYEDALALSARSVMESASVRARPTLWDLALLHAQARADAIWTRGEDGLLRDANGQQQARLPEGPSFGAFLFRDVELSAGSVAASLRDMVADGAEQVSFEELLDMVTAHAAPETVSAV